MKKTWLALTIVVVAAGAFIVPTWISHNSETGISEEASTPPSSAPPLSPEELAMAQEIHALQGAVEEALAWRAQALGFAKELAAADEAGRPYSSDQLVRIQKGVESYLEVRKRLWGLADKYFWMGSKDRHLAFGPGTGGTKNVDKHLKGKIVVDPEDRLGRLTLQGVKVSLGAGLVLYDNYLVAIHPFARQDKVRRIIEFDNGAIGRALKQVTDSYLDKENMARVLRGIAFYRAEQKWRSEEAAKGRPRHESDQEIYLDNLINSSASFDYLGSQSRVALFFKKIKIGLAQKGDAFDAFKDQSMNAMSKMFGNTVGLIQSRQGKLKNLPDEEVEGIIRQMRPLDVLLEKTPFRLTDRFIPGHFGHVAVWLGNGEQFDDLVKELGLQNDPLVLKYRAQIHQGHGVLEALRPGVMLNTFDHFLDIDDLAVIRPKSLSQDQKKRYLLNALRQIGKEYDFNFDVESDKKIVCSELAYVVYTPEEKWPTSRQMGRVTISPDNVAIKANPGGTFDVILLYHDGSRVSNAAQKYTELLTDPTTLERTEEIKRLQSSRAPSSLVGESSTEAGFGFR